MDTPRMIMLAIVAIGLFYVVLPIVMFAYLNLRGRWTAARPETGLADDFELDAWHAGAASGARAACRRATGVGEAV